MKFRNGPSAFLLMVILLVPCCSTVYAEDSTNVEIYASENLLKKCDSLISLFANKPNILGTIENVGLVLHDKRMITVNGKRVFALAIGCREFGQMALIDSCDTQHMRYRLDFNIPGAHCFIDDEVRDINGDDVDEIRINLSAGAHGFHSYFVSVYDDSLSLIKDGNGSYSFFAMVGGIETRDIDGDGVEEIMVDNMPDQDGIEYHTVYKWNGVNYIAQPKVKK